MIAGIRRLFLVLFTLLQCLAPLLHAHAASEPHAGVHLPAWLHDAAVGGTGGEASWHAAESAQATVIGEARSLEAFDPMPFLDVDTRPWWLSGRTGAPLAWASPPAPHAAPTWLHPALRAPPRA